MSSNEQLYISEHTNTLRFEDTTILWHSLLGNPIAINDASLFELKSVINDGVKKPFHQKLVDEMLKAGHFEKRKIDQRANWEQDIERRIGLAGVYVEGISFNLTNKCNLKCDYCISNYSIKKNGEMSFSVAKSCIDQYVSLIASKNDSKTVSLSFTGGEPLSKFGLIKQITNYFTDSLPERTFNRRIITNGTLVSDDVAAFLKINDFDVAVSLDGLNVAQNAHRKLINGSGSWGKVIVGIEALRRADVNFTISSVYSDEYRDSYRNSFIPYLAKIGVTDVACNIDNLSKISIDPKELAKWFVDTRKIAQSFGISFTGAWAVPGSYLLAKNKIDRWAICSGASQYAMFLHYDGSVKLCEYYDDSLGNIRNFKEVLIKSIETQKKYKFGSWEVCRGCSIEGFCSPCILEKKLWHNNEKRQLLKCEFIKHATELLLVESLIENKHNKAIKSDL